MILISVLLAVSIGVGAACDARQMHAAEGYLELVGNLRTLVEAGQLDRAAYEESYISALWQRDEQWLKCLVSHHHIREVDAGLEHLRTALRQRWQGEALLALDEIGDAFVDIRDDHLPTLVNII